MSVWLLLRRALVTHRGAAVLLAMVVAIGAFLGAAAPRWIDGRLDETVRAMIDEAGPAAQVSARERGPVTPTRFDDQIRGLRESVDPALAELFGDGRWSSSTGPRTFVTQNGTDAYDPLLPRRLDVRTPDRLADRVRLVEGELPSAVADDGTTLFLDVVATREVADALRLSVGDTVTFEVPPATGIDADQPETERAPGVRLSGLIEAVERDDRLWADARTALSPDLGTPGAEPRITTGTLLSDRALVPGWTASTGVSLSTEWHVILEASAAQASQVDAVTAELRRLATGTMWSSGLVDTLSAYPAQRAAAEGVVGSGVFSLAALCAALTLLSIRLLAERRCDEVALARTRGAGDVPLARLLALDALVITAPAAALGVLAAVIVLSGDGGLLSLALPAGLVVVAVVALPVMALRAAAQSGLAPGSAQRADVAATHPSARRLVAEAGVVVLAGLGLWLAGSRQPGAGVDPVVSLAPILVAGAAGLVIFRVMPYLVAAVLPGLRRSGTLVPFLAVTRTARAPGHAVLPVIALLVAIGVATFGGTVQASVGQAREASSWNEVSGQALVESDVIRVDPGQITAIPGADAVANGYVVQSQRPVNLANGRAAGVDILAVDVEAWQEVTAPAPTPPDVVAAMSAPTESGAPAAVLKGSLDVISIGDQLEVTLGEQQVIVEVVGAFPDVPGATSGTTLVVPLHPVAEAMPTWPDVLYVGGTVTVGGIADTLGIDTDSVTLRSEVLATIYGDTVLTAVLDVFEIVTVLSAVLAAAASVLGLAIGERTRIYGLSVLRTLGLTTRQSALLTASDIVPTSIVAAVAGIGIGTGVGLVIAGALDLPALSGVISRGSATQTVADVPAAVLSAGAVLGIVLVAVAFAVVAGRRAQLGSILRAGESP